MNPKCVKCEKTETILWRKQADAGEICNDCYESEKTEKLEIAAKKETTETEETPKEEVVKEAVVAETKIRKSTRSTRFKNKAITRQKSKSTSRRSNTFKSARPTKTPTGSAETKTKTHVFQDGFYYQIGDIVSLMSKGKKYYAQIRSLIVSFIVTQLSDIFNLLNILDRHFLRKVCGIDLAHSHHIVSRSEREIRSSHLSCGSRRRYPKTNRKHNGVHHACAIDLLLQQDRSLSASGRTIRWLIFREEQARVHLGQCRLISS